MKQYPRKYSLQISLLVFFLNLISARGGDGQASHLFGDYCYDCHDDLTKKGNLDLMEIFKQGSFDGTLIFENLITGKMPPPEKTQPSPEEKKRMLDWLAASQPDHKPKSFRRISRHEFVYSVNDLLGIRLNLADQIPEDRGTKNFDSDRRIELSKDMIGSYFKAADEMLEFAFPKNGIPNERTWITGKVKDSHSTYNIYHRPYEDGVLFSWTRANNGNTYSFFYDHFEPQVSGWYDLTFDTAKVGAFPEDISLQVYAGKYYYADDRPQPQRMLGVLSVGHQELRSKTIRVFLHPGENVSVHCYSRHNFRQKDTKAGLYIKQLKVRGPVYDQWPPASYQKIFGDLVMKTPPRETSQHAKFQTNLQRIGGSLRVSSSQKGMEKEKMQDGSHRTFWHTQFKPILAKGPHYVILENPEGASIEGLNYAAWTGGNGNGQVERYSIFLSDNGTTWGEPVVEGRLETRLANEQPILFPKPTQLPFIKFLITDAISMDDQSIASIGKLDVMSAWEEQWPTTQITMASKSKKSLEQVIRNFAQQAFATSLTEEQLSPFVEVSLDAYAVSQDFIEATRTGLKAILCSMRFLMAPGEHANSSYANASALSRIMWLSVPDAKLLARAHNNQVTESQSIRAEINRMLDDDRTRRMIHSISDQWLNLKSWATISPSLKLYPKYNDLLDYYLPKETHAYLSHMLRENEPVAHFIDSDYAFLNQRLAQHYDVAGVVGQGLRKVTFAPESPRGGLLTMGSVLKVTTDGYDTSPILRGAWISRNVVGNPLSPPPENVEAIEPEHGAETTSLREQIEQHKKSKTCYTCHKSIDPYGFALENFDATGQWRTQYRVKKEHNATFQYRPQGYFSLGSRVDASGEIGEFAFNDIFGLKEILLSEHRKIAYNFAKKFFEYANGHEPNLQQRIDLLKMIPDKAEDCGMRDLIGDVVVYSLKGTVE